MPVVDPLQAALAAVAAQVVALVVGFGILDNTTAGLVTAVTVSVVNLGFLIANSIHHHANAQLPTEINVERKK